MIDEMNSKIIEFREFLGKPMTRNSVFEELSGRNVGNV